MSWNLLFYSRPDAISSTFATLVEENQSIFINDEAKDQVHAAAQAAISLVEDGLVGPAEEVEISLIGHSTINFEPDGDTMPFIQIRVQGFKYAAKPAETPAQSQSREEFDASMAASTLDNPDNAGPGQNAEDRIEH